MPNNIDVTSPGDSAALANSLGGFSYINPDQPYRASTGSGLTNYTRNVKYKA